MRYVIHTKDGVEIFKAVWNGEITLDLPRDYGVDMVIVNEPDPVTIEETADQTPVKEDILFSPTDDITEKQTLEAALAQKAEELAIANARIAELEARGPETASPVDPLGEELERTRRANRQRLEEDAKQPIPEEIAALLDEGETFTHDVRRKLTERLNVELAELKNLRGLAGEDLKREAEIEKLLGLFARLGEI